MNNKEIKENNGNYNTLSDVVDLIKKADNNRRSKINNMENLEEALKIYNQSYDKLNAIKNRIPKLIGWVYDAKIRVRQNKTADSIFYLKHPEYLERFNNTFNYYL
jgi:hypothetical protein